MTSHFVPLSASGFQFRRGETEIVTFFGNNLIIEQTLQHGEKSRSNGLKLLQVMARQPVERLLAVAGQFDQNLALVIGCAEPDQEAALDEAIDQADDTMMLQLHTLSEDPNRRLHAFGQAFDGEQQLLLLRL